jgi:hypothetical protein
MTTKSKVMFETLLNNLKLLGTGIAIHFSGGGDSGSIEEIFPYDPDDDDYEGTDYKAKENFQKVAKNLIIKVNSSNKIINTSEEVSLYDFIIDVAFTLLRENESGWEIDYGSDGYIYIHLTEDEKALAISFEVNTYYLESSQREYSVTYEV